MDERLRNIINDRLGACLELIKDEKLQWSDETPWDTTPMLGIAKAAYCLSQLRDGLRDGSLSPSEAALLMHDGLLLTNVATLDGIEKVMQTGFKVRGSLDEGRKKAAEAHKPLAKAYVIREIERVRKERRIVKTGKIKREAAKRLGTSLATLYRILQK